jgi:hypothetical protein
MMKKALFLNTFGDDEDEVSRIEFNQQSSQNIRPQRHISQTPTKLPYARASIPIARGIASRFTLNGSFANLSPDALMTSRTVTGGFFQNDKSFFRQ